MSKIQIWTKLILKWSWFDSYSFKGHFNQGRFARLSNAIIMNNRHVHFLLNLFFFGIIILSFSRVYCWSLGWTDVHDKPWFHPDSPLYHISLSFVLWVKFKETQSQFHLINTNILIVTIWNLIQYYYKIMLD